MVDVSATRLLRTDVLQSAEELAGGRFRNRGCLAGRQRIELGELGDSEVEYLRPTAIVDHDVSRLDVAVHDAVSVRLLESVGNFGGDAHDLADRHRAALQPIAQRLPFDVLHGDEGRAVVGFARLVDDGHIRMREFGGRDRFTNEAPLRLRLCAREDLQRDVSLQRRILGQVHLPHPAHPKWSNDAIPPDGIRDHRNGPFSSALLRARANSEGTRFSCQHTREGS